ncbi:hypothetical protein OG21DRAFT_1506989 [Imleria badia]|nr:hypothetical protein OG21DRAFT_1506989 [Imleria badia]
MRFYFFAVFSGLAALAVVNALPAENLQADVPVATGIPVTGPKHDPCCILRAPWGLGCAIPAACWPKTKAPAVT